jgi:formate dehydrogenase major subunit/NADH-quinone oxidoreductase subunit G
MSLATIVVDGQKIQAEEGSRLLWAILDAGLWVPNLCAIRELEPPDGGCRLCWVEVEGRDKPVTSCTQPVKDGMVVRTRSEAVDRLVRAGFEMLMSTHRLDCKDCPGNRRCALQEIAKKRKIPLRGKRLKKFEPDFPVDASRPDLGLNPNHCVLCGRCVYVCNHEVKKGILDIINRGLDSVVSTFDGEPLAQQDCGDCTRCAEVCPTHAIWKK